MTLLRSKIVFDTQVISDISTGVIPRKEWTAVLKHISRRCRYLISANTLYELLVGIAKGDEAHFIDNQNRVRVLCEPTGKQFLQLVGDFIRSTVFTLEPRKPDFQPQKLKLWIEVVLKAGSKSDLVHGRVSLQGRSDSAITYGFDLPLLAKQVESGKKNHSLSLENLRLGKLIASTPQKWVQAVLRETEVPINPGNEKTLLDALDAAIRHDLSLYDLAKNHLYDFTEHDSDWIDGQQLLYLADPCLT